MNKSFLIKYKWVLSTFVLGLFVLASYTYSHLDSSNAATNQNSVTDLYSPNGGNPCLGDITIFAGNYAPQGWALCNGQLIQISSNEALFSIIGCTWGGDCRTTFALPDLRGRATIHFGNGTGLPNYNLGQNGGVASYSVNPSVTNGEAGGPSGTGDITAITGVTEVPGSGISDPYQPSLGLNYIIATQGVYCSRN